MRGSPGVPLAPSSLTWEPRGKTESTIPCKGLDCSSLPLLPAAGAPGPPDPLHACTQHGSLRARQAQTHAVMTPVTGHFQEKGQHNRGLQPPCCQSTPITLRSTRALRPGGPPHSTDFEGPICSSATTPSAGNAVLQKVIRVRKPATSEGFRGQGET